jgi:hypothetical protein
MEIWQKDPSNKTIVHRRWEDKVIKYNNVTKTWPISYGSLLREPGRIYGDGLVLGILKEIQRLNVLIKGNIEAIERQQNPIKVYDPNSFKNPELVQKTPNGGWLAMHNMAMGGVQPLQMDLNIAPALQLEKDLQQNIRDGLYLDVFMLPEQPYMTASEVLARLDQKIQILVPMVEGLQYDLVHQLVLHVAERVLKMNILPNRPVDLNLDLVRLGLETRFDKLKNITTQSNIMTFMQNLGTMAQMNPEVLDNFNFDVISNALHRSSYLPANFTRDEYEVQEIRENRAKAMAEDKAMALQAQTGKPMQ